MGAQPCTRLTLVASPLDGTEAFTALFDQTFDPGISAHSYVRFAGTKVYYAVDAWGENLPSTLNITTYDLATGQYETVFEESPEGVYFIEPWVTDTGELYLAGYDIDNTYLWRVEQGQKVLIASWADEEEGYPFPYIADGIVINLTYKNKIRGAQIHDFAGNLLLSTDKLYPDDIEGLEGDPSAMGTSFIGGDREKIMIQLSRTNWHAVLAETAPPATTTAVPGTSSAAEPKTYAAITGYDPEQAKQLLKTACDELAAAGLYTPGEEIVIQVCWQIRDNSVSQEEGSLVQVLSHQLNAAAEGSGFGKITLTPVSQSSMYPSSAIPGGEYAMGAVSGTSAAYEPFQYMRSRFDAVYYSSVTIDGGCWDPRTELLTLNAEGQEVTMTWKDWSVANDQGGLYATADISTRLAILAQMEQQYLEKYYDIPLYAQAAYVNQDMLSYKVDCYTRTHNLRIGDFGGIRLLKFNYSDAQWQAFVAENGGKLDYTK